MTTSLNQSAQISSKKCVDMALSAPSACNRQPFNFLLLANAEKRDEVLKLAPGSKGWANKAPYVAAFVADYSSFEQKYDHGLAMIDASLFSAYLQIAFSSHGIGSCCLNWPDKDQLHLPVGNIWALFSSDRSDAYGFWVSNRIRIDSEINKEKERRNHQGGRVRFK